MKRFMIGSLVATIVMYVWGAVFWMSPQPYQVLQRTANDAAIGKLLRDNFPESGTYLVPGAYNDKQTAAALFKAGPIATIHLQREGAEMMSPKVLLLGFIHQLITVLLLAALLSMALPALPRYLSRVVFITLAGIVAAFFINLGDPIWWHHPWPLHLVAALHNVVAWFLAALLLAIFIKPGAPSPAAPQEAALKEEALGKQV